MIKPVIAWSRRTAGLSILANLLFSWTILPLMIPPGGVYSFQELIEVILWQGLGAAGWPLALLGGSVNLLMQGKISDLLPLLLVLIYPISLLLLILVLLSKRPKRWALALLHLLITFSFAAVWHQIRNGYDFMRG